MNKKTVFLTGATGTMGKAGLKELLHRTDRFNITLLVRPSKRNQKSMAQYEKNPNIRIVWGDLNNYDDILATVTGADIVLHVGGLVSPKADYVPKQTLRVNIGAVENIVKAIKAQPDPDNIKLVYIGSVAQTGHRNPPIHWGRTGDPISASIHDYYGLSKTVAERIVAESGLKHWVSLRQSGILSTEMLFNGSDPISFHVPIAGVLEWATTEDSGRLLANVCEDNVPEEFWNRFYNISSGASYRLTNYEFEAKVMKALSCPAPEKIFGANWFATENFHGQWYTDADVLENYLHFRANIPSDEYFRQLAASLPWYFRLAKIVPACLIKAVMHTVAAKKRYGTLDWIKNRNDEMVKAYFGSYEAWEEIPDWDKQNLKRPSETPRLLDHGYDETKPQQLWDIDDMRKAAAFRGGKCLSETMTVGDIATPLEWECQFGHRFKASPRLILLGGHWCPECEPAPWNYGKIAQGNPFFAQIWEPFHGKNDNRVYPGELNAKR